MNDQINPCVVEMNWLLLTMSEVYNYIELRDELVKQQITILKPNQIPKLF